MHTHSLFLFFITVIFLLVSVHTVNALSTGGFQVVDSCQKHNSCAEEQGQSRRLSVRFRRWEFGGGEGEGDGGEEDGVEE